MSHVFEDRFDWIHRNHIEILKLTTTDEKVVTRRAVHPCITSKCIKENSSKVF